MKHLTLLPVLATALTAPVSAANYTAGHGDIGIAYEDEGSGPEFHFHYHIGSTAIVDGSPVGGVDGVEYEPGELVTFVPSSTELLMPTAPALEAGTGVAAGGSLWVLPISSMADTPFLGIATEELAADDWVGNIVFTLNSVVSPSGSGHFSVWDSDSFGNPTFHFSTATGENTLALPAGVHAHFNYGFSEPGTWTVDLSVTGTHVTDGFMSDSGTFTFQVVPEPSTALLGGLGGLAFCMRRRRLG